MQNFVKENLAVSTNVRKESTTVTKNITLEGVSVLKAEKVKTVYEVVYELHPKTNKPVRLLSKRKIDEMVKPMRFPLKEVTPEELKTYRKKSVSSFVLKVEGKLYHTPIPNNISFVSSEIMGPHRCAASGHECRRLSAASDEKGGCAKVRELSTGIEKYPWIVDGYETFSTGHDVFCVVTCQHYEKFPPRKPQSVVEFNQVRLSLAEFVVPELVNKLK